MRQKLYVLSGDVLSSRKIRDREEVQRKLEEACGEVNSTYSEGIYADFKILKGTDEIGGVLSTIANSYNIITTILERIHPDSMRFVLVFDYIDAALGTGDVARMDGPVFHRASDIMNKLKKSDLLFDMFVGDRMIDACISGQINLILLLKSNWSAKQYQTVKEYEEIGNQYKVARKLGITQQAVSKTLNSVMWKEIKSIEDKLNSVLLEVHKSDKS
ncbi:MAG: SatD family protein [Chloroflexota bacterium]